MRKAKHAAQGALGKAKEAAGKTVGNESLEAEGRTDQAKANMKQAADNVADAAKNITDR